MHSYDLLAIGNYTKDTIVSAAGTREVHGGGYSYAAHAATLRNLAVGAVTRLAPEDRHSTEALTARGVAVHVIESPRSTLMRLEYPTANVDERRLTVAEMADPFTPDLLADFEARAILVNGSLRGEMPLDAIELLRRNGQMVCADLQGFVRVRSEDGQLAYAPWPEQSRVLALVDVLKTDAVEAGFLTGLGDLRAAAAALAACGPSEIVLTHRDGLLVFADGRYHQAAFRPDELRGRSGRGDTCIGAYASARLEVPPADATLWAAAVTSLKLEREGPVQGKADDVRRLITARYGDGFRCEPD